MLMFIVSVYGDGHRVVIFEIITHWCVILCHLNFLYVVLKLFSCCLN